MSLTVLSVAYPFAPVGDAAVGGAERVLTMLDEALVARGVRSLVAAVEGSRSAGKLFAFPQARPEMDGEERRWYRKQLQCVVDRVLATERVDVVHLHGLDFEEYTLPADMPVLVSLHVHVPWEKVRAWKQRHPLAHFHCVSRALRAEWPFADENAAVVENGVELPVFREVQRREYALVMGRICAEKNAHEALEAGTLAGVPVWVAGQVFPYADHERYFEEQVRPRLMEQGSVDHRFLGALTAAERHEMLARARCLLHPTRAQETSSLVAMEALAAGTPVIAYPSGALPEIVEHGVTGFLVENVQEMAGALKLVDRIRPEVCRAVAERRFSSERMVSGVVELYRKLARGGVKEKRYA